MWDRAEITIKIMKFRPGPISDKKEYLLNCFILVENIHYPATMSILRFLKFMKKL